MPTVTGEEQGDVSLFCDPVEAEVQDLEVISKYVVDQHFEWKLRPHAGF